ncbi:MAG: HlyD family efflux transporter periplasmic adaptor subunit [Halomonadaceae bacterium]|nr:MAG: HlyD family efflux transporter periplasmic adaptor subunit [Halomonadaceae bacterium]
MNRSLFRKEVINHQRERLWGDIILAQPLSLQLVTGIIAVILISLIAYLVLGTYTRKETVPGYLVPSQGLVHVHAPQPGTVKELAVEFGDKVQQGDSLIKVRTDQSLEDGATLNVMVINLLDQRKQALKQRIKRHKSRKQARRHYLQSRIQGLESQIDQLTRQRALQVKRKELALNRYEALEALHRDELISDEEYESRYQTMLDQRQRYEQLSQSLLSEHARLEEAHFELDSLTSETAETLDELESEISRLRQQKLQHRGEQAFSIQAPVDGKVTSLQAVVGQRVDHQRPLLAILPEGDELRADLFVPTRAIGFIEPELPVRVRYEAFPHERFGIHESRVNQVAGTILGPHEVDAPIRLDEPVYRVSTRLKSQHLYAFGREMPLQSGMLLEADVLLDERPLYQWILRPLYSLRGTL